MSLADVLDELDKEGSSDNSNEGSSEEVTEQEIKEAHAAGRIAGAAFNDELQKIAQEAKTEEMGDQYKEDENADTSPSENSDEATVDKLRRAINDDQMATRDNNNDQGAESSENNKDTDGPQPQKPETNEEEDVTASALQSLLQ